MNFLKTISLITIASLILFSCKKDDENNVPPIEETSKFGSIKIMVDSRMKSKSEDMADILLDSAYITGNGDTVRFSKFKYFISNLKLINASGDTLAIPESYHLIQASNNEYTTKITLDSVPVDMYEGIIYTLGLDAKANLDETIIEGDLDPNTDMSWNWQVGYKFINIEGTYSGDTKGNIIFHLGKTENAKTHYLDFPKSLMVENTASSSKIHMVSNFNKLFNNVYNIDVEAVNNVKVGPDDQLKKFVQNYKDGLFMIHHIENGESSDMNHSH